MVEWLDKIRLAEARHRYVRSASTFLQIAGVDLHLTEEGRRSAAPALILLSSQWLGVSHGDRMVPLVSDAHHLVRMDLPGQGLSGGFPDGDYSANAYAGLVAQAISQLDLGDHVVIGTSFSGIAAAIYAASRPPGLRGLVLATSSGLPRPAGSPSPGVVPSKGSFSQTRGGRRPRRFYEWKMQSLLRRPIAADIFARLVDEVHILNELPHRNAEARMRVAQYDPGQFSRALPSVDVPLLIQWSSNSTYLPPAMATQIATIAPQVAGVHHYSDTGHLLIQDAAEDCARDILGFVRQL